MKWLVCLLVFVLPLVAQDTARLERDLDRIAEVATIMVDGDECQRLLTPRAVQHILAKNPRDPWASSDNYDVNDAAFIHTKKTLIRLAQLARYPVDVNLWMPLAADPPRVHIAIRNRYEMSQFWEWGQLHQEMIPSMQTVLAGGARQTVKQKPGYVSVLAPVQNSLGDVVGLVEVVSQTQFDPRENVK